MSVTAKNLFEGTFATASAATVYTAPAATRTIIDKFTALNTDASARTLTIHIIASGGTATDTNMVVKALSLAAGASQEVTELKNHILETGDKIQILASVTSVVTTRASGREVA